MAELALGIVGVVPVALLILKAHKSTKQKLRKLKTYGKEAQRLDRELSTQRHIFLNDWQILLESAVQDADVLSAMKDDLSHDYWSSPELKIELKNYLGQHYEICLRNIKAIYQSSEVLDSELQRIDTLGDDSNQVERKGSVLSKVQDRLRVLRCSEGLTDPIKDLKDAISQLGTLLRQVHKLHKREKERKSWCRTRSSTDSVYLATWGECLRMRKASTNLHTGLAEVWRCGDSDHNKHLFNLFVNADESEDAIQLRLAIILDCQTQRQVYPNMAQLEVWSKDVTWLEPVTAATLDEEERISRQAKRPRITRLAYTTASSSASTHLELPSSSSDEDIHRQSSPDLRCAEDTCSRLTRETPPASPMDPLRQGPCCLGHIEVLSEPKFRHTFYSGAGNALNGQTSPAPSTLLGMIRNKRVRIVDPLHKLWLARSVAMTMLKLHSTPWLGKLWTLQDLAMLVPDDIEDLSKSLETMHVNVEFARTLTDLMEDVQAPGADHQAFHDPMTDQEILCNISWPLWSLGVAFLQIDRWAEFDVEDVVAVRKAAKLSSSVSPKFRILTERCLDCDFGRALGKDISKSGLQQAVCSKVVGELDTLISSTEGMSLVVPSDSEE